MVARSICGACRPLQKFAPVPRSRTSLISGPISRSTRAISWPISLVIRLPSLGRLRMTSRQSALVSNRTGAVTGTLALLIADCLLRGYARLLDDVLPFRQLFDDAPMEILWSASGCVEARVQEAVAHVRASHHAGQRRSETLDNLPGRAGRHHDALPGIGERGRYTGFADRRHVGQFGPALAAAHRQTFHGADADLRLGDSDGGRGHVDGLAEQRLRRRSCARIGDVHHVDPGMELEELARKMRQRAGAWR